MFQGHLSLTCSKCTRCERFKGADPTQAAEKAKREGWTMPVERRFNCPRCSGTKRKKAAA